MQDMSVCILYHLLLLDRSVCGNMASISTLFTVCLVICISAGNANKDFVSLECSVKNVGQYGQESLLMCVIHTTQEVRNPEIRVVTWRKDGQNEPLLVFHEMKTNSKSGYKFAEPSWNNRNLNVSLLIANTKVTDHGGYTCTVITDSGTCRRQTTLDVAAKYNTPTITSIPARIPQGADATLICKTDGGFPKGQLRWFDNYKTDWTKSSEMTFEETKDGLYHLSSKLTLKSGSIFKYTCVVYNASEEKVDEAKFDPEPNPGPSTGDQVATSLKLESKIVAPVVVIGSLIVGLLLALLFIKWRSRRERQLVCTEDTERGNMDTD
ncbi:hypothetical protein Q5P01_025062 [Channa striata]|uniref:Ig-like domain-containing protein n=1 Tax=Channa striata TaxID=64152 RepID=A0AA88LL92_CHASR|nr:hypothetical protein Q5P01_025062 [Channa striata]